ncbi:MAG TPA: GIY-YIG nuclease family protein [Candidatus Paceibacterota bacterium]|nr:GIY-YIG nuclease family protein [Candidatus Paceibacterota bacterium]
MKNQVLQLLVPNEANGYKVVQLAGWAGKCFIVPRTELKELGKRTEMNDPGIYFLFGEDDESTNQKLYIGESERFYDRLVSHDANKDFWNTAIIFTSGLDKAKVKYLEFLSTNEANKTNRFDLLNSVSPKENNLSEFDVISTQDYFLKMKYILTVLGYPVFQSVRESLSSHETYYLKGEGFDAKSQLLEDGSLNVLKGSSVRIKEAESLEGWPVAARERFLGEGILKKEDGNNVSYVFTQDVLFKSPSAAAKTVAGRSVNGWTAWKDEKGRTLDENLRNE